MGEILTEREVDGLHDVAFDPYVDTVQREAAIERLRLHDVALRAALTAAEQDRERFKRAYTDSETWRVAAEAERAQAITRADRAEGRIWHGYPKEVQRQANVIDVLHGMVEAIEAERDEAQAVAKAAVKDLRAVCDERDEAIRERDEVRRMNGLKDRLLMEGNEMIRTLEARERTLREALTKYGQHPPECHTQDHWAGIHPSVCTCGLDAALTGDDDDA